MLKRTILLLLSVVIFGMSMFCQTKSTLPVNIVEIIDNKFLSMFRRLILPYLKKNYPDTSKCTLLTEETIKGPNEHYAFIYAYDPEGIMHRDFNDDIKSMGIIDGYRIFFKSEMMKHTFDQYFQIIGKDNIVLNFFPDSDVSGRVEWIFTVDEGQLYEYLYPPIPKE